MLAAKAAALALGPCASCVDRKPYDSTIVLPNVRCTAPRQLQGLARLGGKSKAQHLSRHAWVRRPSLICAGFSGRSSPGWTLLPFSTEEPEWLSQDMGLS